MMPVPKRLTYHWPQEKPFRTFSINASGYVQREQYEVRVEGKKIGYVGKVARSSDLSLVWCAWDVNKKWLGTTYKRGIAGEIVREAYNAVDRA